MNKLNFIKFLPIILISINFLFLINIELMGYFYIILFIFLFNIYIKKFINLYYFDKINFLEKVIYFNSLLILEYVKERELEEVSCFKRSIYEPYYYY